MGGEGKTAFGLHFKVKFANMNKVNYQKILEQTIEKNERENRVPMLLYTVAVHRAVPIAWNIFQIILKLLFFIIIRIFIRRRSTVSGWQSSRSLLKNFR